MDTSTLIFIILPIVACTVTIINYNHEAPIDPTMTGLTLVGILLFYKAPLYSKSTSFYYICSVTLGCLGTNLILFFIISRFLPKKLAAASLFLSWGTLGFVYRLFKNRIFQLFYNYGTYIAVYTMFSAVIALAYAYRYGPPTHPKTLNLVQWTIQFISLSLILLSNPIQLVGLSLCALIVIHYNFSHFWPRLTSRLKPLEPRSLLTEDEFYLQGLLTTQKELKKLRDYCRSPDVDPWKVVNKLKTPDRFAKFMVTGDDVGEEERSIYDTSCFDDSDEMIEDMDTTGDLEGDEERESEIGPGGDTIMFDASYSNSHRNSEINPQHSSDNRLIINDNQPRNLFTNLNQSVKINESQKIFN
ncbi:nuclear envelope integral membrane protein 1-like [Panonychus citri]|uniref:nuclear envelope integral membrane protein 1-like n=1 Tax=Panonychus citri TaxID=50023 RepID=UPI002307E004|nr:nuclear envelope integral membrane protein 1-like [Panonychus citri]